MCTHVLEIAERLCHRVGIVQRGRLTRVGTISDLRAQAAHSGSLEDVFLALTGGDQYRDLLKFLA
jgi:ABC-2 type transport system ATP-binding protein